MARKKGKKGLTTLERAMAKEKAGAFKQRLQPKFGRKDVMETQFQMSQNQQVLNSMFGGGVGRRVLGDNRPKINKTLQGGNQPFGLIKNDDEGYTASLMLPTKFGRRTL